MRVLKWSLSVKLRTSDCSECEVSNSVRFRTVWGFEQCEVANSVRFRTVWGCEHCEFANSVRLRTVWDFEQCEVANSVRFRTVWGFEKFEVLNSVRFRTPSKRRAVANVRGAGWRGKLLLGTACTMATKRLISVPKTSTMTEGMKLLPTQ